MREFRLAVLKNKACYWFSFRAKTKNV